MRQYKITYELVDWFPSFKPKDPRIKENYEYVWANDEIEARSKFYKKHSFDFAEERRLLFVERVENEEN